MIDHRPEEAIRIDCERDDAAAAQMEESLHAENARRSAVFAQCLADPKDPAPLHLFVRAPSGEPVAGLVGRIWRAYGWLQVDILWISEACRSKGLGAKLLRAAEDEARRQGCTRARLFTRSFQAPGFYEKMGYEPYGLLEEFPPGASEHYFQKRL